MTAPVTGQLADMVPPTDPRELNANIIEIDDAWAGANRQRIVQRWVAEVLNAT